MFDASFDASFDEFPDAGSPGDTEVRVILGMAEPGWNSISMTTRAAAVDGAVSIIGSANCNHRSTLLDDEVNLVVFDPEFATELDADFDTDVTRSERIDLTRWERRGPVQRTFERVMHQIRPWL